MEKVGGLDENSTQHMDICFEEGGLLGEGLLASERVPGGAVVAGSNGIHGPLLDSGGIRSYRLETLTLDRELSFKRSDFCG